MLYMRYCIYHPSRRVHSWSGHVHHQMDDRITIIAGHCDECNKRDLRPIESRCTGCYGRLG